MKNIKREDQPRKEQKMKKKNAWVACLATPAVIAMLLFAGSTSVRASDQPSAAKAEVKIDNFSFGPETLTVAVGTTVTWTNRDDIPHTVVSTDGVFQVQGAGYGRKVLLHICQGGNVSLLLLGPSEDDRQDRGAVRLDFWKTLYRQL
jgi:plastocyanin